MLACSSGVNLVAVPGMSTYDYPVKTLRAIIIGGHDLIGRLEEVAAATWGSISAPPR
jgi:hypothetical protein